ncbi:hypothetical protein BDD43_0074 [Mucilaginibacter gracilis]|uniref:CRP-like cAMP-binding protein n=1 Tax=Mucilaginibacter gracilis TaxID=423350 RepID=A0A495ITA6_9SPHI|nr:Crp/Fnr family transcriptional regulator [Mucilaginibacter gracilis]RKR79987.1 hypothetical protein BDD43_0074 [Mucilaginibacter gracilis]
MKNYIELSWHQDALEKLAAHLNSFREQRPLLYEHLGNVMEPKQVNPKAGEMLFNPQRVIDKSYYIYEGFVIILKEIENQGRQVLSIYKKDSIVSSDSFEAREASGLYLYATPGARLLEVTYQQMREVYSTFPETHELAKLILGYWHKKELEMRAILNKEALIVVEWFYINYPEFLTRYHKLLADPELSTFLLIKEKTLKLARTKLLKAGRIKWFIR